MGIFLFLHVGGAKNIDNTNQS